MKRVYFTFLLALMSVLTFAQEGGGGADINITTTTSETGFWTSPWVWIVGAAVFILLLVALTRGGSRRD